jgi:hypothetical protein
MMKIRPTAHINVSTHIYAYTGTQTDDILRMIYGGKIRKFIKFWGWIPSLSQLLLIKRYMEKERQNYSFMDFSI